MKKFFSLIAAVLFAGSMMATEVTVSKTVEELATANSWANGTVVTPFALDEVITVSTDATDANTGKYYTSGQQVRLYQTGAAKLIVTAAEGYTISSITLTYASQNTGIFVEAESGVAVDFGNVQSAIFTVGNSGEATNGQARVTSISVTYDGGEVPPIEPTMDYYVVGSMTSWKADAAYKLAANPVVEGEYMAEFAFAANAEFKVAYSDGTTIEDANWFPQGPDNNYKITEAGDYTVYFRPAGNTEWENGYFTAVKKEEPVVTAITCAAVYDLAKNDVVDLLNPVTVTYVNGKNVWVKDETAALLLYLPANATYAAGDVLTGAAGVVDIYNALVYEIKPSADQVKAIVATAGEAPAAEAVAQVTKADVNKYIVMQNVTAEGTFAEGTASNITINGVTVRNNFKNAYTFEAGKTYNVYGVVSAFSDKPQVYFITAEVTGETPIEPTMDYYVVGSMTNWKADAAYKLAANPGAEGEYMANFTFAANDEFKVAYSDGTTIEDANWFPQGMGNNYKINKDGYYTVYFRPAGNADWENGYFTAVEKEIKQYEVAEAIAAGLAEGDEVLVRGVITKMEFKGANFAKYGSVNIYVADATGAEGEFEFYNCFSFNADTFKTSTPAYDATSTAWAEFKMVADENGNEIRVGDTIIAQGKYKLFNETHELNTGCYITDLKPAPVAPAQDINVNMSDGLRYDDYVASDGWWQIYGSDEQYSVSISNVATTQAEGTYTIADLDADYTYITAINSTDTTHFVDGSVILSIDAQTGNVTVVGTLVGNDGNNYIFNLQYIVPTPQETVNVNIADGELYDEYAEDGLYVVYGEDANEVYVQLAIWAENGFEGNFTEEDLDGQYVGSFLYEGEEYVEIYSATITVTPGNGGDYNVTATILGYNNKQYNVTMYVPGGEGIEETLAAGKAAKVLRDGQILILKGDKTFNVMGARIR